MIKMQDFLSHAPDQDLVQMSKQGNKEALIVLIQRYAPLVRQRARVFAGKSLDLDDLYQEGMIALLSSVRGYHEEKGGTFKTFVTACVNNKLRNVIVSHMRGKNLPMRDYLSLSDTNEESELPALQEDPAGIVIADEQLAVWREQIETLLSPFERDVLKLYLSAYSYEEMARRLQSSTKAIDNALQRARRKLRGAFAQDM